jgi:hypothetical protein
MRRHRSPVDPVALITTSAREGRQNRRGTTAPAGTGAHSTVLAAPVNTSAREGRQTCVEAATGRTPRVTVAAYPSAVRHRPRGRRAATTANVLGLVAAVSALFTPALAFAPLAALDAAAFLLGLIASSREHKAGTLGVLGGLAAVVVAMVFYSRYQEAMEILDELGRLGL